MTISHTSVAPNTELLGEIVSWDMHGQDTAFADVQQAMLEAGIPASFATDLSTRAAFTRACKHLKENRQIDKLETRNGTMAFQFTRKTMENGGYEFDRECFVEVDVDTGAVECPQKPELAETARELLAHAMQTRNASDITRIVQNLFKSQADLYAINKKGAAYFVPEAHREFTAKVEQFITKMGGAMSRFPVPKGTEEGNRSVRDAVSAGLQEMLEELNEAVEGWNEKTKETTMEKVQERYQLIAGKIDAYATYLLGAQEKLLDEVKASKERMVDRMIALQESKESKDEELVAV